MLTNRHNILILLIFATIIMGRLNSVIADTITLQPNAIDGKDALLVLGTYNDVDYSDLNFGDSSLLASDYSFGGENKGLIEFDLSSYTGSGMVVTNATIDLYQWSQPAEGAEFGIYRVLSSWDEMTVTWNSSPSIANLPISTVTLDSAISRMVQWDITSLVQGWLSGTYDNYGMALMRIDNPNPQTYFFSSDRGGTNIPKLVINYSTTPVPEPTTMAFLGFGLLGLAGVVRRIK